MQMLYEHIFWKPIRPSISSALPILFLHHVGVSVNAEISFKPLKSVAVKPVEIKHFRDPETLNFADNQKTASHKISSISQQNKRETPPGSTY